MKFRCHSYGKDVVEELLDERVIEDLWYCKPYYEAWLSETDSKIIEDWKAGYEIDLEENKDKVK